MKLWPRRKKEEIQNIEDDVRQLEDDINEVRERRPKVEDKVAKLHNHLQDNNFGQRLYLQMVESRR